MRLATARPAAARFLGECEERRAVVEAVSAASSADRRESWEVAKAEGSSGVGRDMVVEDVMCVAGFSSPGRHGRQCQRY